MADIKNQNTLYRFVSLRAPELSKKEDQETRFVFHPDNSTGQFFDAITNKPSDQSKWEALQAKATNFTSIISETEINSNPLFSCSDWLARNKSYAKVDEINKKITGLSILNPSLELQLWDNLFYQVVTQQSFYIKEGLIQILVLQNLLKRIENITDVKIISEIILPLANAKVVLPTVLFQETDSQNTNSSKIGDETETSILSLSKEIIDAQQIAFSKLTISNYENIISELKNLSKKYQKEKQIAFDKANLTYQNQIKPIIQTYQKEYNRLKREICKLPRDANYNPDDFCNQPDIEYPNLPDFVFTYPKETDITFLTDNLDPESFKIISSIVTLDEVDTIDEIVDALNNANKEEHKKIAEKIQFSEKIIAFGDVAINVSSSKVATGDNIPFEICSTRLGNGNVSIFMSIEFPNSSYNILQIHYTLHFTNGSSNTSGAYVKTTNGNVMTLAHLFNDNIPFSQSAIVTSIDGYFKFTNGQEYTFEVDPFKLDGCYSGDLILKGGTNSDGNDNSGSNTNSFIPKGFGFRQLGIADYKKVVSEVCCYDAGEVAHIENIMAREIREKVTTRTHRSEITTTESTEIETEKLTDSISTERFEMQTEIAKLLSEQKQFNAHADVHVTGTGYSLDAGAAYANATTKEESNRQAVTNAKELTQRAMERIVSRVKTEKTVKITNEFVEENKHGFDNTQSDQHVSGVYRFINAIYKNQIYNYGKRLMYEFMIPQPSKLHRLGLQVSSSNNNSVLLQKPVDPRTISYTDFTTINENNYQLLASKYNASVKNFPDKTIYISKTFSGAKAHDNELYNETSDIAIPNGYETKTAKLKMYCRNDDDGSQAHSVGITFGNINLYAQGLNYPINQDNLYGNSPEYTLEGFKEKISFSYAVLNYLTFNIGITIKAELAPDYIVEWQKDTFEAIIKGYEAQLEAYNDMLSQTKAEGVQILDSNPLFYREIEQQTLRKNCISYLIDDTDTTSKRRFGIKMYNNNATFKNHQVTISQDMDDYGSFVKFMEQAFEWNLMSYRFYPYYWGNRDEWNELYQYESNDPIYRSFMQAGMARVVVTVKPGFEDAVMHYMALGQIWNGGQMPVLGDPLYLSIVDELKEQEYVVEETWETVLPTNLIALQKSGVAVDATGLPCGDDCGDNAGSDLKINDNKLGVTLPTP
ncbi:hypothetical protein [Flavobacterium sp.]